MEQVMLLLSILFYKVGELFYVSFSSDLTVNISLQFNKTYEVIFIFKSFFFNQVSIKFLDTWVRNVMLLTVSQINAILCVYL